MGTFIDWYRGGGPVMPLIALVAAAAAGILVERAYSILIRGGMNGRVFMERIIQLVRAGRLEDALKQCANSRSALPDIGLVLLRSRTREEADLQNVAEAAALAVIPKFRRRLDYLPLLSRLALLLGLLGLLMGCSAAFGDAVGAGGLDAGRLVTGLALALRPAISALAVAIPTTIGHAFLTQQANTLGEDIQEFSARLVNALIERPDVRLGHR